MTKIRELEQELDNWRKECLDNFMFQIAYGSSKSIQESRDNYIVAIRSHTIEFANNRQELFKYFYKCN